MANVKGRRPAKRTRRAGKPAAKPLRRRSAKPLRRAAARPAGGFYPPIEPYHSGMLRVSPVHEIYYEQSGNPRGKPAVFLHGGPGGATDPSMR